MQLDIKCLKNGLFVALQDYGLFFSNLCFCSKYSPGALEPEREVPMLPAIVDEISYTVPPVADATVDADSGPVISVQKFVVTYDEPQLIASEQINNINNLVNDYLLDSDKNFNLTELDDLTFLVTENLRAVRFNVG